MLAESLQVLFTDFPSSLREQKKRRTPTTTTRAPFFLGVKASIRQARTAVMVFFLFLFFGWRGGWGEGGFFCVFFMGVLRGGGSSGGFFGEMFFVCFCFVEGRRGEGVREAFSLGGCLFGVFFWEEGGGGVLGACVFLFFFGGEVFLRRAEVPARSAMANL